MQHPPHMMPPPPMLGVTPPISVEGPSALDQKLSSSLMACLQANGVFESESEARTRERVLSKLNQMVKQFVRRRALAKNLPEVIADDAGGKIFTFGSYRLGVHGAGADIDTLCVVPKFVTRDDFFTDFHEKLKALPEVTELTPVPDAYVPVMKMCFAGIQIDLVMAQLNMSSIPDSLELLDDNLLKDLDDRCVRSLNGSRVTDEILRLVPNIPVFRTALRAIKLWAKKRAIYANVLGFLGGVAYAITVARVCQLYPCASDSMIVAKYFSIIGHWPWSAETPVLLKDIVDRRWRFRVWNPKGNPSDRANKMPIITPAYPGMCSTYNVSPSTLKIMTAEMVRGEQVCKRIAEGAAQWDELFEEHNFFGRYKNYLQVITTAKTLDSHNMWSGFVESRLRQLVAKLEYFDVFNAVHPFIKGFESKVPRADDTVVEASSAQEEQGSDEEGAIKPDTVATKDKAKVEANGDENTGISRPSEKSEEQEEEGGEETDPKPQLFTHLMTFYIGLDILQLAGAQKYDLRSQALDFTNLCKEWTGYDAATMDVRIRSIKRSNLPEEVAGPVKARKKRSAASGSPTQPQLDGENPTKKQAQ